MKLIKSLKGRVNEEEITRYSFNNNNNNNV